MTRIIKYCFKTRAIFLPSIQLFHKVIIVLFLRFVICQHINVARLNDSSSESDLTGSGVSKKVSSNTREFPKEKEKERERRDFSDVTTKNCPIIFTVREEEFRIAHNSTEAIQPAVKSVEVKDYRLRESHDISSRVSRAVASRRSAAMNSISLARKIFPIK